ncbi:hypothetical protein [Asaia spathodeae]|uniref:Uncharacterized protein n=1 Tax=Asaia spathodeae TaxID=657016 RepID=A0ABX2P662_9PROT|nr:hypothetical protein [Asaia spathodeae]GBR18808.1 hypothetical protein AA105894_2155 [Asaia spathodeae NBRC 105894]
MTRSYDDLAELADKDVISRFDNFVKGLVADLNLNTQGVNNYIYKEKVKGDIEKFRNFILEREGQYYSDYWKMEQSLSERNNYLTQMARDLESTRISLLNDHQERMNALDAEREKFTKEYQSALQENSSSFVQTTVEELKIREKYFSRKSNGWAILGALILMLGLLIVIYLSFMGSSVNHNDMSWPSLLFYSFKGVIILTVVGFLARYGFVMSGNFMQESLKTDNRMHAIKFGQFYIKTYGATANWEQVREVFSSWNGDERTLWEKNIQYDELNNAIQTISSFANKIKSDKTAAKAPETKRKD